jgi:heptosyltransferase-2
MKSKPLRMIIFFFDEIMEIRKICIMHLNQIGDLVFSLPLLKALRENYPESEIHSILRPHLKELLAHSPYVNRLIFREKGIKNRLNLLKEIRQNRYDLLMTLSRSEECLFLAALSRARMKVGFERFPWDFSLDIKERMEGPPSWLNNLKLLRRLNIEVKKKDYVGLIDLSPEKNSWELGDFNMSKEKYVVVSPGTSDRRRLKAWEEQKFADLIMLLKERFGLRAVLVGGADSKEIGDKVMEKIKEGKKDRETHPIKNLTGKTSLKDLCYLLKKASLFVGVDSGIMHLASSFNVPVVGIFGPTDPFFVGPQNAKSVVVREEMECVPCCLKGCEERACMTKLDVKKVFNACEQLINP